MEKRRATEYLNFANVPEFVYPPKQTTTLPNF